eukprot:Hpha_TRINITY_DN16409_c0_g1::TRINITY_DN16409_c0_g1_i8::g.162673::m.162673
MEIPQETSEGNTVETKEGWKAEGVLGYLGREDRPPGLAPDWCTYTSVLHVLDGSAVCPGALVLGPEGEVVADQLHDQRRLLVFLLREGLELLHSLVEVALRQRDTLLSLLHDLVVEHRQVQHETKTGGVRHRQGRLGRVQSRRVRLQSLLLVARVVSRLDVVTVVVSLHLLEEHLVVAGHVTLQHVLVKQSDDILADLRQLALYNLAVGLDLGGVASPLLLLPLLDAGQDTPARATQPNRVLVRNAQQVALVLAELRVLLHDPLHAQHHLVVPLGLLRQLRGEDHVLARRRHLELGRHERHCRRLCFLCSSETAIKY